MEWVNVSALLTTLSFFLCLHQSCNIQIYLLFYCSVYMLVYGYLYIIHQIKLSFICFYQYLLLFTKKGSFIFLAICFYKKVILKSRFCRKRNGYSWSASRFILKIVNIPSMLYCHPFSIETETMDYQNSTVAKYSGFIMAWEFSYLPPSNLGGWQQLKKKKN